MKLFPEGISIEKYTIVEKYKNAFVKGQKALKDGDFESAKLHFTSALTILFQNSPMFHFYLEKMSDKLMAQLSLACSNLKKPDVINDVIDSHIKTFSLNEKLENVLNRYRVVESSLSQSWTYLKNSFI